MKATLTSKGQVTIPLKLRQRLGLKAGTVLEFDETAPFLKATRTIDPESWALFGKKGKDPWPGLDSHEVIEELRGAMKMPPKNKRS